MEAIRSRILKAKEPTIKGVKAKLKILTEVIILSEVFKGFFY